MNGFKETENYEEIKIPVPWGHVAGKWWGPKNIQPIIAIHGWQDNCGTFDNLAPILCDKGLSLLCIDLPGHGFSSHIPQGQMYYLFWDGLHVVRRVVKHFHFTDVILMGHSLGGGISFLYASIFPNEIKKYISIDIASPSVRSIKRMVDGAGPSVDKFLDYEKKYREPLVYNDYNEMVDVVLDAHGGSLTRESSKIMLRRGMKAAENQAGFIFTRDPRLKIAGLGFITLDQVMEMASRITCEVLNVRATPGLKWENPELYNQVLDRIEMNAKKLERLSFKGTHHLHLNNAEDIAPCIYSFIKSENDLVI